MSPTPQTVVLLSAGLDSAVLAAHEAQRGLVHPVYVATGLAWETQERAMLRRLLASPPFESVAPLVELEFSVRDLYSPTHWALRGEAPGFDTPDEDVYLAGRNIILLSKTAVFCAQKNVDRIALGPLAGNPFPDATPSFFQSMATTLSLGLAHQVHIDTPFQTMHKPDVVKLGARLGVPFELTLSCMQPIEDQHCGLCSKCRERRDGFIEADVPDPTPYRTAPAR